MFICLYVCGMNKEAKELFKDWLNSLDTSQNIMEHLIGQEAFHIRFLEFTNTQQPKPEAVESAREYIKTLPSVKDGLDSFYGQQTVINALTDFNRSRIEHAKKANAELMEELTEANGIIDFEAKKNESEIEDLKKTLEKIKVLSKERIGRVTNFRRIVYDIQELLSKIDKS